MPSSLPRLSSKTSTGSPGIIFLFLVFMMAAPGARSQVPPPGFTQSGASATASPQPQSENDRLTSALPSDAHHRVSLYLALRDKKDRPITDLKPADIAITDGGRLVDSQELRIAQEAQGGDHVITLLFDRLDAAGYRNAGRAARNILKNLGEGSSGIGVWAIDQRLRIVQSYTADRKLVANAINNATGGPELLSSAATTEEAHLLAAASAGDADTRTARQKLWDRSSLQAISDAQRAAAQQRAPWGIASLFAAAQAQRPLAGRKVIIYFSQTVPSNLDASDLFRSASHSLRDASISVFAVDLNSLDAGTEEGMQAAIAMGGTAANVHYNIEANLHSTAPGSQTMGLGSMAFKAMGDTIAGIEFQGMTGSKNLLAQLADATGGMATNADASTRNMCRQINADLENYYTISYTESDREDGRFHPITVKILRAGVKADARPGHFANAATNTAGNGAAGGTDEVLTPEIVSGNEEAADLDTLSAGATASDLVLRSAMLELGSSAARTHAVLALEAPIQQLAFHEDGNTGLFSLHATVAVQLRNAAGEPVARFHEEFRRHGSAEFAERLRSEFLSMERPVNLPSGDYHLDAVVRDWNSDKLGKSSQTIHLVDTEDTRVLSDLVLVRSTEEKEGAAGSLPYGHAHVVPNLSGELPGDTRAAALYFQVYPLAKTSGPASLHIEVAKDGKLIASLPMRIEASRSETGSSRVANLTLGNGSGAYDLTLCLERDGTTTKRHISVVSLAPDAADSAPGKEELAKFEPPSIDLDLKQTTRQLAPAESKALISAAREHALAYGHSLPNFLCVESINRSIDAKGRGVWKKVDSIVELLRYADKNETRTVLEVNGVKSHVEADRLPGARSNGEFGGILQIIFDPAANADFAWLKTEEKDGQVLQVYSYTIDAKNSQFMLTAPDRSQIPAPFHGLVLIDNDTRAVRRLIAQTGELPADFGIKASFMSVDYDYIGINGHDYLLPTSGEVGMRQGKTQAISNELRFSHYRRFVSNTRIVNLDDYANQPAH